MYVFSSRGFVFFVKTFICFNCVLFLGKKNNGIASDGPKFHLFAGWSGHEEVAVYDQEPFVEGCGVEAMFRKGRRLWVLSLHRKCRLQQSKKKQKPQLFTVIFEVQRHQLTMDFLSKSPKSCFFAKFSLECNWCVLPPQPTSPKKTSLRIGDFRK